MSLQVRLAVSLVYWGSPLCLWSAADQTGIHAHLYWDFSWFWDLCWAARLTYLHLIWSQPPAGGLKFVLLWRPWTKRKSESVQGLLVLKVGTDSMSVPSHSIGQRKWWGQPRCKRCWDEESSPHDWRSCNVILQRIWVQGGVVENETIFNHYTLQLHIWMGGGWIIWHLELHQV